VHAVSFPAPSECYLRHVYEQQRMAALLLVGLRDRTLVAAAGKNAWSLVLII